MYWLGRGAAAITVVALLLGMAPTVVLAAQPTAPQTDDLGPLQASLTGALGQDREGEQPRLQGVDIDSTGNGTIIFSIQNAADDGPATRQGAVSDTLALLRTAYQSPAASRLSTLTVLGTFPFKSTKGRAVRDFPVLRAVLSAERAAPLNWDAVGPSDVSDVVDTWWLQGAFANVDNAPPETADVAPGGVSATAPVGDDPSPALAAIRSRLTIALAHLTEAVTALSADQRQIGRSQFKQFFDAWDDVDAQVRDLDPTTYAALDVDLEQAEIALLHTLPENVGAARLALQDIRSRLLEILASEPDPLLS